MNRRSEKRLSGCPIFILGAINVVRDSGFKKSKSMSEYLFWTGFTRWTGLISIL